MAEAVATPAAVVSECFEAFAAHDADRMVACWAPGGVDRIAAAGEFRAPEEVRQLFAELFTAVPDLEIDVESKVTRNDRVAVQWRWRGTFAGGPLQGVAPTGSRIEVAGMDLFRVADGLIQENDAYYDGAGFARQVGILPPKGSAGERLMTAAFNLRTRLRAALPAPKLEEVAAGVWLLRGGVPSKIMNVYLIADRDGVTVFDAGIYGMRAAIARAAYELGGIKRIVLGHAHPDHRGSAPYLAAPVYCHPDDVADAEGDGGRHYYDYSLIEWRPARIAEPHLIDMWDGGPVKIAGTFNEGDEVAGFKVFHFPGHSPGQVALLRESDGLALVSDTIYTLNPETGRRSEARTPHPAFNENTELARASIRRLAGLEPNAVWPGHADPVLTDVKQRLLRAAQSQ